VGNSNLNDGETAFAVFVMILCGLLIPVFMFVRFSPAGPAVDVGRADPADAGAGSPADAPVPPLPPLPPTGGRPGRMMRKHMSRAERARWHEAGAWRVKGPPFPVRVFNFVRGLVVGTSVTTLLLIATAVWLFIAM